MKPPELEALMLGALLDSEDQGKALELAGFTEDTLFDPRVRIAWALTARLVARRRKVDAVTLFSAARAGNLMREEDLDWLNGLQAANSLKGDSLVHLFEDHRRKYKGRAIADQLARAVEGIHTHGLRPAELQGVLESIGHQLVVDYAPEERTETDVAEVIDDWDCRLRGEMAGGSLVMPTGIQIVDDVVKGFVPGLNMILGDPGIGKSAIIGSIIEAQLEAGQVIGLFGLEEGYRWLTKRLLARDLGMSVGDVGVTARTPEQEAKLGDVGKRLFDLYKGRFLGYRHDRLSIGELCRRGAHWVIAKNARALYVDHIGEVEHERAYGSQGENWATANTYRRLRDLGKRLGVPVIAIAHRKPEARARPGPPQPNDVGLTGEAEKMVRRMVGLWRKGNSLRLTVIKNNEGKIDETVELNRLYDSALIAREGGRRINLDQEAREDREAKRIDRLENGLADAKWRAEKKQPKGSPPAEPEEPAEPPPQATLIDVPPSTKPESNQ